MYEFWASVRVIIISGARNTVIREEAVEVSNNRRKVRVSAKPRRVIKSLDSCGNFLRVWIQYSPSLFFRSHQYLPYLSSYRLSNRFFEFLDQRVGEMKFNIESVQLSSSSHLRTERMTRDLPILFPYPRIYPGQGRKMCEPGGTSLTSRRTICVCQSHGTVTGSKPANDVWGAGTCAISNVC